MNGSVFIEFKDQDEEGDIFHQVVKDFDNKWSMLYGFLKLWICTFGVWEHVKNER